MKKEKFTKWRKIAQLQIALKEDDSLSNVDKQDIECIMHGAFMGYGSWVFKYKGIYVMLWDAGNGHYEFGTRITRLEVLCCRIVNMYYAIQAKRRDNHEISG